MFRYALIGILAFGAAAVAVKAVVRLDEARQAQAPAAVSAPMAATARIERSGDGHYWADGEVDGEPVRFLVDTGATAVALTPDDAERVGLNPRGLDYDLEVVTAQGRARAAKVMLETLSVDGAEVDDVEALVIEQGLQTSLLGMSYLGRLSRFEASPQALELEP
ncbi:MAG TPA: TIGR02281 family clan AA aspartic protease [Caulobacteraceae bacterium]